MSDPVTTTEHQIDFESLETEDGVMQLVNGLVQSVLSLAHEKGGDACAVMGNLANVALRQMIANGHPNCAANVAAKVLFSAATNSGAAPDADGNIVIEGTFDADKKVH